MQSATSESALVSNTDSHHGQSMSTDFKGMRRLEARRILEEHHFLAGRARSRRYNTPVDLRLLDYVSVYDNNLMCPICRCPFVDPVILLECPHCFCRDCLRQAWNTESAPGPLGLKGNCPTCRAPAKVDPGPNTGKILINMTDELLVKCPKTAEGCKAVVKRGEVQDHIDIYCGYALTECMAEKCELPVLRKDAAQECLHYGVSCLSCHKETQKWSLESHWRNECPERKVQCDFCKSAVLYRDFDLHRKQTCSAIGIPCPGAQFGCANRSKDAQAETHADTCPLAKLAPILTKQQERLEAQEIAQKQLVRKLDVLETGFTAMQSILRPSAVQGSGGLSAGPSYLTSSRDLLAAQADMTSTGNLDFAVPSSPSDGTENTTAMLRGPPAGPTPAVPGPRPHDLPEPYTADYDFELPATFQNPAVDSSPYASPLHHLLSMHESLRDEMTRISSALSELDGRHSMQSLNENLRTREEISYLGAQVGGLQRQVHWLTSAQLQRQQIGRSPTPGYEGSAGSVISDAAAGAGVEAAVGAVSTAATALRGAARMVSVSGRDGAGMRRRPSEEGRTKL